MQYCSSSVCKMQPRSCRGRGAPQLGSRRCFRCPRAQVKVCHGRYEVTFVITFIGPDDQVRADAASVLGRRDIRSAHLVNALQHSKMQHVQTQSKIRIRDISGGFWCHEHFFEFSSDGAFCEVHSGRMSSWFHSRATNSNWGGPSVSGKFR